MIKSSDILTELNLENGSNYKISVLKKYSDHEPLKRLLKMTYDKVCFTYGIRKILPVTTNRSVHTLEAALNFLEEYLHTRELTGNSALEVLQTLMSQLSPEDSRIIELVLERNLKINLGRSNINKVFKNLIVKPVYMRCSILTNDNKKKVQYPAILNLKADGTYRETTVDGSNVSYNSRSGEEYDYPLLTEEYSKLPDGKYISELTVVLDKALLKKITPKLQKADDKNGTNLVGEITTKFESGDLILNRAIGNGLIKSGDVPHENIISEVWDYVTLDEYRVAANKDKKVKNKTPYWSRFQRLQDIIQTENRVRVIESVEVNSLSEVMKQTSIWMNKGLEGGILKNRDAIFKDGTSTEQWKIKLVIDAEVRVVGFIEGTPGTSREKTFGSIVFETDDKKIKGSTSGFTKEQLEDINSRRDEVMNSIFTVEFNDITKGRKNNYYAFSHPRYIEFRDDKDSTDTLERCLEMKEMAMNLA